MSEEINHNRRSRPEASLAIIAQVLRGIDGLRESSTGEGEG